jgi:hypothetical protein
MLAALGLRSEFVQAGIETIKEEIARTSGDENLQSPTQKGASKKAKKTGRAFLFAGYMVDYPAKDRKTFPADKEKEIRQEILKVLEDFNLNPNDRAFVGGLSAGSEIIFAEICAEKGVKTRAYLPLPESAYIRQFVSPGGDAWVNRFYEIRNNQLMEELYQIENVGMPREGDDPFERNNRWALYSSLGRGLDKVTLIALWNSHGGDKPKDRDARLVYHMIELMRDMGGPVVQISTSKYINRMIDNVLDRLMDDGAQKSGAAPIGRKASKGKK